MSEVENKTKQGMKMFPVDCQLWSRRERCLSHL